MNTISLLITLAGIITIIGLYLMSRIAQSKLPQTLQTQIPNLKNDDGSKFSSVLEDIPARDGSTPKSAPMQKVTISSNPKKHSSSTSSISSPKEEEKTDKENLPRQVILFISANAETGLDGNLVQKALTANKLILGDKDIYHYYSENPTNKSSLFRVANGTEPWTLTTKDLQDKNLAGLSIVMSLPSQIADKKALKLLLSVSKKLCKEINGSLKNHKQQTLTNNEEKEIMNS